MSKQQVENKSVCVHKASAGCKPAVSIDTAWNCPESEFTVNSL